MQVEQGDLSNDGRIVDVDAALKPANLGIAAVMAPVGLLFLVEYGVSSFLFIIAVLTYWIVGLLFARSMLGLRRWNVGLLAVMAVCAVGASVSSGGSSSPILFFAGVIAIVGRAFFPNRLVIVSSGPGIVAVVGLVDVFAGRNVVLIPFLCAVVLAGYLPYIIGRLVALEERQRRRAVLDHLTGCLNRHALDARTAELEAQSRLTNLGMAAIVFDIDHFKLVNDEQGHATGDLVLTEVAYIARKHLRRFELLYRLGGEEFAVLLPGANLAFAVSAAERLRTAIESASTNGVRVTASFGVAVGEAPFSVEAVLHEADVRLYAAKTGGRNCVVSTAVDEQILVTH